MRFAVLYALARSPLSQWRPPAAARRLRLGPIAPGSALSWHIDPQHEPVRKPEEWWRASPGGPWSAGGAA